MSNLTINQLPAANTIDPVNDLLGIYQNSSVSTLSISRNTYLGLASAPVGITDSQTLTNKVLTSPSISGPTLSGTVVGTYTIGGTPTFPASVVTLTGSQTLTNKVLTSPTINSPTITNASLTTDTITGFTTAGTGSIYGLGIAAGAFTTSNIIPTAAIQNNAVTSTKVSGIDKSLLTTDSNPYKFRVYRNSAASSGNGAFAKITFDTKIFDTNNNFSSGTYTVPITGYYQINWSIRFTINSVGCVAALYKNGSTLVYGGQAKGNGAIFTSVGSEPIFVTAGDTLEIYAYADSTTALDTPAGNAANLFSGFLVSRT